MKTISLTQNKVAIVDDEDFDYLNQLKWYAHKDYKTKTFYAARSVYLKNGKSTTEQMHRLILNPPQGMQIDHIDGNGLNNQKSNLQIVTPRANCQNLHIKKSSHFPGVTWHKGSKCWQSQIRIDGRYKYLGIFTDEEKAHQRYMEALP